MKCCFAKEEYGTRFEDLIKNKIEFNSFDDFSLWFSKNYSVEFGLLLCDDERLGSSYVYIVSVIYKDYCDFRSVGRLWFDEE